MHLTALRVCRQVYNEANFVLWTTNTFSFADSANPSFLTFMKSWTMHQKQLLKRPRLQMDWDYLDEDSWTRTFGMPLIRSLTGLRKLRLQINRPLGAENYHRRRAQGHWLGVLQTRPWGLLDRLSILPLTDVEIFFNNFFGGSLPHDPWTNQERAAYAEEVRQRLLDPKGAEIYTQRQKQIQDARRKKQRKEKGS